MKKQFKRALFIHRRDLRVQDNVGLSAALRAADEVLPCFIFDPVQVGSTNVYRSERQVAFMIESLEDLAGQYIKVDGLLFAFEGAPHEVVAQLIKNAGVDAVLLNADYTPYAKERDQKIHAICSELNIPFIVHHDLLLSGNPDAIRTGDGNPYTVFTPFWKKARDVVVAKPQPLTEGVFVTDPSLFSNHVLEVPLRKHYPAQAGPLVIPAGRMHAREILGSLEQFAKYDDERDFPEKPTTHLSAHLKFGTVSIREVFHACVRELRDPNALIRQLYWRDFYTYIVYHFPHVVGNSYQPEHNKLFFNTDLTHFDAWKEGRTGFPIVDAGMRELAATGYMHNRVRLIVGSFLTKDLHIGWWEGEKYFAGQLIDYDLSANNGNWQWVGGTGTDPVPYFRIFNPWLQSKRFDPDGTYIKRWIPELRDVPAAQLHALDMKPLEDGHPYPQPIVSHHDELQKVKALYGAQM